MMNKNVSIRDHHLGKYIYRYYKKEACKILELFENINKNADEKNIHQFRVAIKKLRAVFHLLEMLYPFKFISKDHYKIIKPIFKIAGIIREDQINHSII